MPLYEYITIYYVSSFLALNKQAFHEHHWTYLLVHVCMHFCWVHTQEWTCWILGHMFIFSFKITAKQVSVVLVLIYFPTKSVWELQLLYNPANTLYFSHSGGWVVVFHYDFNINVPDDWRSYDVKIMLGEFYMLIGHLTTLFCEVSILIFYQSELSVFSILNDLQKLFMNFEWVL